MIIAFTGTRQGMTEAQQGKLAGLLSSYKPSGLRHGDCVGADAQAHLIATNLGIQIAIHHPSNMSNRAFCKGAVVTYKPEPYLDRNHYMVDRCNLLIACPEGIEALRSGTWATVRYARKRPRNHLIIYPDGTTFEQLYPARS